MSTQAKYSWAIGLVIIGIVFALPFRQTRSSQVAQSQNELSQEGAETVSPPQMLVDAEKATNLNSQTSTAAAESSQSNLLPHVSGYVEDQPNLVPTVEPSRLNHGTGAVANGADGNVVLNDRPATLQPVEFSNQVARQTMPESVGPYQMKPVPTSRFLAASQSNARNGQVFSTASRTRNVVHYKLRDGDTLRSIAQRYLGNPDRYTEIMNDNAHVFTNGENFLPIGQFVTIIVQ